MKTSEIANMIAYLLLLILLTAQSFNSAFADNTSPEKEGHATFVAKGRYLVFEGVSFPAVFQYDEIKKIAWLDVQASKDYKSWVIFDWSLPFPSGYIGNDHQCFTMALPTDKIPSSSKLLVNISTTKQPLLNTSPHQLSKGIYAINDKIIINNGEDIMLLFDADTIEYTKPAPPPKINIGKCQPLKQLTPSLSSSQTKPAKKPKLGRDDDPLSIEVNQYYTFHGIGYKMLDYVAPSFKQTKTEYVTAVENCKNEKDCKSKWEGGGAFGRYGRYCGDGWGTGSGKPLSGMDYCCKLHDAESWDKSGEFGHEARNLCGLLACMSCRSNLGDSDWWSNNFDGDYSAYQVLLALVAPATGLLYCSPRDVFHLGGFTCRSEE